MSGMRAEIVNEEEADQDQERGDEESKEEQHPDRTRKEESSCNLHGDQAKSKGNLPTLDLDGTFITSPDADEEQKRAKIALLH